MITEVLKMEYPEAFWYFKKKAKSQKQFNKLCEEYLKKHNKDLYDIVLALQYFKDISLYNDKERIDITFYPSVAFDTDYRITINHKWYSHSVETYKTEKEVINMARRLLKQGYKYEIYD